jgi:hypothetical protein
LSRDIRCGDAQPCIVALARGELRSFAGAISAKGLGGCGKYKLLYKYQWLGAVLDVKEFLYFNTKKLVGLTGLNRLNRVYVEARKK